MILYNKFYRELGVRTSATINKIVPLENVKELPLGSVLHVLDNLKFRQNIFLTPDVNNPLYKLPPSKKLIFNVTPLKTPLVDSYNDKIKPLSIGLAASLTKFRQQDTINIKYMDTPYNTVARPTIQNVFCYNSIFNCRITGVLKHYRIVNFIFANLISMVNKTPEVQHFINIPVDNIIFSKSDFIRAFKKVDKTTLRYSESSYYIFVLYLLSELEPESISIFKNFLPDVIDNVNFVLTSAKECYIFNLGKILEFSKKADIRLKLLNALNTLASSDELLEEDELLQVNDELVNVNTTSLTPNSPAFRTTTTNEEIQQNIIKDIDELKNDSIDNITTDESLTPAQKNTLSEYVKDYKNIKIGNETVEEIMNSKVDQNIDGNRLDFLDNDSDIPDKSMLSSSTIELGAAYLKNLAKKDLASTLLSFNKLGMILTDVTETEASDFMNKVVNYRVTFKDTSFKNHTIKFSLPKIDDDGTCLVNGSKKKLKIQRVNNPIVKVSPTRVTLNSNYNKCLVERNTNVANEFFPYILKMVQKSKVKTHVEYATQVIATLETDNIELDDSYKKYFENNVAFEYDNDKLELNDYVLTSLGYVVVIKKDSKVTLLPTINPKKVAAEYCNLAEKISEIKINNDIFYFNFKERNKNIKNSILSKALSLENKYGVYIGTARNKSYYIDVNGSLYIVDIDKNSVLSTTTIIDEIAELTKTTPSPLNEYCNVKILNKKIPIAVVLSYKFGLLNMLDYLNTDYEVYPKGTRLPNDIALSDIKVKFMDKTLIIKRTPVLNCLIFSGLNYFNFKEVALEDMDGRDIYYDLFNSVGISPNVLKGIDSFFDLFMDPATKDVLFQMHEPTNFKDLLIRAVSLLTTADHKPPSSSDNFRFRTYETFNAVVYRELSSAYSSYKYKTFNSTNKFSIKDNEIERKITKSQIFNNLDILNPIHDVKQTCGFTHIGDGGRSSESFVIDDRKFPEDGVGIISEATLDSGGVGMTAQLSMNPTISNARGLTISKEPDECTPSEILSLTALLVPTSTQDDGKRCNFLSTQMSQYVATKKSDVCRIRTGYEKILAHRTTLPFAYSAEDDGKLLDINNASELIKIEYKDGRKICLHYGQDYSNNSGQGFYATQNIKLNDLKAGKTFKKGDVLVYNEDYFTADPYSSQVNWNMGTLANVAIMETDDTMEDSSAICRSLSSKLEFEPVHIRMLNLTKDTTVHQIADIGTEVAASDKLITFDESSVGELEAQGMDTTTIELLNKMNKATPKAKHSGKVVRIELFYKCPVEEMSESMQILIKKYNGVKNKKAKYAKSCDNSGEYLPIEPITSTNRLGNDILDQDNVLIKFYIQDTLDALRGDKIVVGSSLKSVIAKVYEDNDIVTEEGLPIDVSFSCLSITNRIINTPVLIGMTNKILDDLESEVLKIWNS